MRILLRTFLVLLLSITLYAENKEYGVGIGLTGDTATIRVPIYLEEMLRIEPMVALSYRSYDNYSQTGLTLGAAVHVLQKPSDKVTTYYGANGQLGVNNTDYDSGYGRDVDNTDVLFGAVAGFEYYLDPKVSIGGEVGGYLGFGDVFTLSTSTQALLRYYF